MYLVGRIERLAAYRFLAPLRLLCGRSAPVELLIERIEVAHPVEVAFAHAGIRPQAPLADQSEQSVAVHVQAAQRLALIYKRESTCLPHQVSVPRQVEP